MNPEDILRNIKLSKRDIARCVKYLEDLICVVDSQFRAVMRRQGIPHSVSFCECSDSRLIPLYQGLLYFLLKRRLTKTFKQFLWGLEREANWLCIEIVSKEKAMKKSNVIGFEQYLKTADFIAKIRDYIKILESKRGG